MNIQKLSIQGLPYFSDFIKNYLNGDERLKEFYAFEPEIASFKKIIENKSKEKVNRELLVDCLQKQYEGFEVHEKLRKNIDALKDKNTFTVTTGHQLCLFTGPLYFIYKIVTTINLSKKLKESYPEYNFVPVFWMASEDHDFEEVNHVHLFGKKYFWEEKSGAAVGRMSTDKIAKVIADIKTLFDEVKERDTLFDLLEQAYLKNNKLSAATRHLINALFVKEGLVIIDGDDKNLKKPLIPIIEKDIIENDNYHHVNKSIDALIAQEILSKNKIQVKPRPINFFYLKDNIRSRIEKEGNQYRVIDTPIYFSEEALKKEIYSHPENFSPNVIIRPLFQELILPNLAYVGGSGEITYWLELKNMFDQHNIQFPLLVLRNSVLLLEAADIKSINSFALISEELFKSTDELIAIIIKDKEGTRLMEHIEKVLKNYAEEVPKEGINEKELKVWEEVQKKKCIKEIMHLEKKFIREEKKKNPELVKRIIQMKEKLFPEGSLQERHQNFIPYFFLKGELFIEELLKELEPMTNEFTIISVV